MNLNKYYPQQSVYAIRVSEGIQAVQPAQTFMSVDSEVTRFPLRHIHSTVTGKCKKTPTTMITSNNKE